MPDGKACDRGLGDRRCQNQALETITIAMPYVGVENRAFYNPSWSSGRGTMDC